MRVQAIYQFYLNFVLPRLEAGREPEGIALNAPDFRAFVRPKHLHEPLFPDDIDKTLAAMSLDLQRADGGEGGIDIVVAASCLDRICVVLEWDMDLEGAEVSDEIQQLSLRRATEAADYYLEHYRYAAMSPYVMRIPRFWRPEDGQFHVGAPSTTSWFNLDTGERLAIINGVNARAESGAIRAPESGVTTSAQLDASLQTGTEPPLHRSLLIDADGYIQSLALREATLSLASACEIAAQLLIVRCGGESDPRIRPILELKSIPFAERYYNLLPRAIGAQAFEDNHRESFELIKEMYQQRNELIHEGKFKENVYSMGRPERHLIVHSWLVAAREAVDWIDDIATVD